VTRSTKPVRRHRRFNSTVILIIVRVILFTMVLAFAEQLMAQGHELYAVASAVALLVGAAASASRRLTAGLSTVSS
jgi:hypothetical protein